MLMFRLHPGSPQAIAATVDATRRVHGLTGKPIKSGRLHVSLTGFRDQREIDEATVRAAAAAAATIRVSAFDLTFDRIGSFWNGEPKPLVLLCGKGADQVAALQRQIVDALNDAGFGFRRRGGFVPHCTVLYDKRLVPETLLGRAIVMPVTGFHLLRSKFGNRQNLGSWPLLD